MLQVGDKVRLLRVPSEVKDIPGMNTREVFAKCVGSVFSVVAFNEIGWAELPVESVTGSIGETLWVEPEHLEVVSK
jgi:hypothetical protein